jgi:hypothetical protein
MSAVLIDSKKFAHHSLLKERKEEQECAGLPTFPPLILHKYQKKRLTEMAFRK